MIINELLKEIKTNSTLEQLKVLCNKMKSENEYNNKILDNPETLYYHRILDNGFYEEFLTLTFDSLGENSYRVNKYSFKKVKENEDPIFKKFGTVIINKKSATEILVEYAKILKKLL